MKKGQIFEVRKECPYYSDAIELEVSDPCVLKKTNTCIQAIGAGTATVTVKATPTAEGFDPLQLTFPLTVRGVRLVDESGKVLSSKERIPAGGSKILRVEKYGMDDDCKIELRANPGDLRVDSCYQNDPDCFLITANGDAGENKDAKLILTAKGSNYQDGAIYDFTIEGSSDEEVYILSNSGNALL